MNFQGEPAVADPQTRGGDASTVDTAQPAVNLPSSFRKRAIARLDEFVAEHGMPTKAVAAIKKASEAVPLVELAAFIKRAVAALASRGLFKGPLDDQALSTLDEPAAPAQMPLEQIPDSYDWASPDELDAQGVIAQQFADAPATTDGDGGPQIVGDKINSNWHSFAPESGTLGLARDQMPQIKAEHRGALVQFLKGKGIAHSAEEVPADSLKPTQAEFSPQKVRRAMAFKGGDRSILVSQEGHVLDGTHQWLAKHVSGEPVKAIRLGAPIEDLLRLAHQFPSSTTSKGSSRLAAGSTAQPSKIQNEIQQSNRSQGNQANGIQGIAQGQGDGVQEGIRQGADQNGSDASGSKIGPQNAVSGQGQHGQNGQGDHGASASVGLVDGQVLGAEPGAAAQADEGQAGQLHGLKPAFDYREHPDGTVTVIGDPAEIKAALPGVRGLTSRSGVTYGRSVANEVIQALYALAQPPEPQQEAEPAQLADDTNPQIGADGAQAEAAPDQASQDGTGDDAPAAGIPDERQPAELQTSGVDPSNAEAPAPSQPGAIESGGVTDEAPGTSAPTQPAQQPESLAALIDLRKREAVLKAIAECMK